MTGFFLAPIGNGQQFFTDAGLPLSGGLIYTYVAGTTTPTSTYTTSAGTTPNSNPIVLNAAGRPPQEIWLTSGVQYKFVVQNSVGVPTNPSTYDNLSGINDTSLVSQTVSEWILYGTPPTYLSTVSFSVPGNQTAIFQPNRRVQAQVTAGTVYGTIASSVYTSVTTVTLNMDSGQNLDSGLSQIYYALLSATHPSVPTVFTNFTTSLITGNTTLQIKTGSTPTVAATFDNSQNVAFAAGMSVAGSATVTGNLTVSGVFAPITGSTVSLATSGSLSTLTITDIGSNGANIKLVGNGGTTPNKSIRAYNGSLQVINSAYSTPIASMDDSGNLTLGGGSGNLIGNASTATQIQNYSVFSAYLSGSQTSGSNLIANTIVRQIGSGYSNSTGVFTAPATGWYSFVGCVTVSGLAANTFATFYMSGSGVVNVVPETLLWSGNSPGLSCVVSTILYLTAGQTVAMTASPGPTVANPFGSPSWFSGHYLGA